MKNTLIICLLLLGTACSKKDILTYDSANYIQFQKSMMDSTTVSFVFYPGEKEVRLPFVLELVGHPAKEDLHYILEVDEKYSSATSANFTLPDQFVFRKEQAVDTCWITFKQTPELDHVNSLRLVLRLKDSDHLLAGRNLYDGAIIRISNRVTKPIWWTTRVTNYRLGAYSDEKFELFIKVTGQYDLTHASDSEISDYSRIFKNYLQKEQEAGRPVYEKDGTLMNVTIVG